MRTVGAANRILSLNCDGEELAAVSTAKTRGYRPAADKRIVFGVLISPDLSYPTPVEFEKMIRAALADVR